VADSPAKEHTQPDQAAWQNVRYYGQNPHEMIYSPPQNDPDFSSLMGRVKSNDQNFTVNSQPYARAPPANDVARAPTPYGDPALQQMMQPDYSRPNPQQSPHGQPTIDEYGRPISMRNPSPVSNTPTYQPEYENFMTPKSFEGQAFNFTEKPNNLAQMIMRDRPHVEPPQVNPNPRPNVNEDWGNTVGGNQRSTARAGPAMMLNSSLNDSKPQNQSRPQVPMFDYQDKSKAGIGSPQSFSIPMSNAPSQTGASRPGLNKFAPLDASPALPLMKTASPFSNPSDPTFSQPSVRSGPQQFLSRDPVLQSAGRPYF
jgi:hypothetical protein